MSIQQMFFGRQGNSLNWSSVGQLGNANVSTSTTEADVVQTIPSGRTVPVGNIVVVLVGGQTTPFSITDTRGNTWQEAVVPTSSFPPGEVHVWWSQITTSLFAGDTISVSYNTIPGSTSYARLASFWEYTVPAGYNVFYGNEYHANHNTSGNAAGNIISGITDERLFVRATLQEQVSISDIFSTSNWTTFPLAAYNTDALVLYGEFYDHVGSINSQPNFPSRLDATSEDSNSVQIALQLYNGVPPTPTPTPSVTPSSVPPTPTPSSVPPTPTPTISVTPSITPSATIPASPTPTPTPSGPAHSSYWGSIGSLGTSGSLEDTYSSTGNVNDTTDRHAHTLTAAAAVGSVIVMLVWNRDASADATAGAISVNEAMSNCGTWSSAVNYVPAYRVQTFYCVVTTAKSAGDVIYIDFEGNSGTATRLVTSWNYSIPAGYAVRRFVTDTQTETHVGTSQPASLSITENGDFLYVRETSFSNEHVDYTNLSVVPNITGTTGFTVMEMAKIDDSRYYQLACEFYMGSGPYTITSAPTRATVGTGGQYTDSMVALELYPPAGVTPTPPPSPTQTPTPTPTISLTPSSTPVTPTPTPTVSNSATPTPTPTISVTPSATMPPTPTPTPSVTPSPSPLPNTWTSIGSLGSTANATSTFNISHTTTAAAAAGSIVAVAIAKDNAAYPLDGNGNEFYICVDNAGNAYEKYGEYGYDGGFNAAGAVIVLFISKLANALPSGGVITTYFNGGNVAAKTMSAWNFGLTSTKSPRYVAQATQNAQNVLSTAMTLSSLASADYLYIRSIAVESNATTALGVTSGFTALTAGNTNTGGVESNMGFRGEFKATTATTGITSDPADYTDSSACHFASLLTAVDSVNSAWKSLGTLGSGTSKTSNSTLTMTTSQGLTAGEVAIVIVARDNYSNAGDGTATSGLGTVTDTAGNTYTKLGEWANNNANGGLGSTVAMYYTKAATTMASGGTITSNLVTQPATAKAMIAWKFELQNGYTTITNVETKTLSTDATAPGSITSTAATNGYEYLVIRAMGGETGTSPATEVSPGFVVMTQAKTTGGTDNTNMLVTGEFTITTKTSVTSAPVVANFDWASLLTVLKAT